MFLPYTLHFMSRSLTSLLMSPEVTATDDKMKRTFIFNEIPYFSVFERRWKHLGYILGHNSTKYMTKKCYIYLYMWVSSAFIIINGISFASDLLFISTPFSENIISCRPTSPLRFWEKRLSVPSPLPCITLHVNLFGMSPCESHAACVVRAIPVEQAPVCVSSGKLDLFEQIMRPSTSKGHNVIFFSGPEESV